MSQNGRSQRKISGFLVSTGPQLEISILVTLLGVLAMGGTIGFFIYRVRRLVGDLVANYTVDPSALEHLDAAVILAVVITVIVAVIFAVANFFAIVMLTHRLIGPSVPMKNLVDQLRQGNYSARAGLRKGDEFQELMLALNDLAADLEKKHGKG